MSVYPSRGGTPAGYTRLGNRCHCICHRMGGVKHVMACCYPNKPEKTLLDEDNGHAD